MNDTLHTTTFVHPITQREYTVKITRDTHHGAPHDEHDGHGVVVRLPFDLEHYILADDERPDEEKMRMALYRKLGPALHTWDHVYYDYIGSIQTAVDEWGCTMADAPAAVEQDYRYLRGWYQGEWEWCTIEATTIVGGEKLTNAISGYESTIIHDPEQLHDVLRDITHDIEIQVRHKYYAGQLELAFYA
jgi:hypothetical protein